MSAAMASDSPKHHRPELARGDWSSAVSPRADSQSASPSARADSQSAEAKQRLELARGIAAKYEAVDVEVKNVIQLIGYVAEDAWINQEDADLEWPIAAPVIKRTCLALFNEMCGAYNVPVYIAGEKVIIVKPEIVEPEAEAEVAEAINRDEVGGGGGNARQLETMQYFKQLIANAAGGSSGSSKKEKRKRAQVDEMDVDNDDVDDDQVGDGNLDISLPEGGDGKSEDEGDESRTGSNDLEANEEAPRDNVETVAIEKSRKKKKRRKIHNKLKKSYKESSSKDTASSKKYIANYLDTMQYFKQLIENNVGHPDNALKKEKRKEQEMESAGVNNSTQNNDIGAKVDQTCVYRCKHCKSLFDSKENHTNHKCTPYSNYNQCEVCGKQFQSRSSYKLHRDACMSESEYTCEQCAKVYKTQELLHRHVATAHAARDHVCPYCGKFMTANYLKPHILAVHQKSHGGGNLQLQTCEYCSAVLSTRAALKTHTRIKHEGKLGTHLCELCPKRFRFKKLLDDHISYIHKGEKANACAECGQTFITRSGLNSHIRFMHKGNGVMEFRCGECARSFRQRAHFNYHLDKWHRNDDKKDVTESSLETPEARAEKSQFALETSEGPPKAPQSPPKAAHSSSKVPASPKVAESPLKGAAPPSNAPAPPSNAPAPPSNAPTSPCQDDESPSKMLDLLLETNPTKATKMEICPVCSRSFRNLTDLEDHVRGKHFRTYQVQVTCLVCDEVCPNLIALKRHMKRLHPNPNAEDD